MIFNSKNENGIPAWKQVLLETKTVTRRLKPIEIGKIRAVQPNRAKKAVGYIEILDCRQETYVGQGIEDIQEEAKKEGFLTWNGLENWFREKYGTPNITVYRIEFKKIPIDK